jgi:hypothetical protein
LALFGIKPWCELLPDAREFREWLMPVHAANVIAHSDLWVCGHWLRH